MTSPIVVNADQGQQYLDRIDLLQELRGMFEELGRGQAVQPAQTLTLFPDDRGDFITYLGVQGQAGVFGAKLSPYIVTADKPVITAWTILISMETGQPLLLCDAGQLTTERTAGTTALAVDYLARPGSRTLAIIGSGGVAKAHLRRVSGLRDWDRVCVYSRSLAGDRARQDEWKALAANLEFSDDAQAAAEDADVVMLCTSSGKPVIDASVIRNGTLVTSISTNVARAHEVDPAWLSNAQVYCDYRKTTPDSAGEMVLARQDHGWNPATIRGDLPELATGNCPMPERDRPLFFRSIGLGLEDIAAAQALLRLVRPTS